MSAPTPRMHGHTEPALDGPRCFVAARVPTFRPAHQFVGDRKLVHVNVGARPSQLDVLLEKLERVHAELVRQVVESGHSDQAALRMVRRTPGTSRADVVDHCGPLNAIVGNTLANQIRDRGRTAAAGPASAPAERIPCGQRSVLFRGHTHARVS